MTSPPTERWFEYPVRVQPHHTDYAGIVWHGTYLTWLEAARVEALRATGLDYASLVAMGCELPVVDLAIHYRQPLTMGMDGLVKARMLPMQGVRVIWDYEISAPDGQVCVTAQVTLVTIDRASQKIIRRLPPALKQSLAMLLPEAPMPPDPQPAPVSAAQSPMQAAPNAAERPPLISPAPEQ